MTDAEQVRRLQELDSLYVRAGVTKSASDRMAYRTAFLEFNREIEILEVVDEGGSGGERES